jgi:Uma2 family endonuclease
MASEAEIKQLKAEDLLHLSDDDQRYELVEGWLFSEPPPSHLHGLLQARVGSLLAGFARSTGAGAVYSGSGFLLAREPDTVRAPDVAFVRRDRVESVGRTGTYFPGAPDIAIEIRSPGDRPAEIRAKVADYLEAGARLVWVIDPQTERVTVYRSLLRPRIVMRDSTLDGEDVLPGFSLALPELFDV